MKQKPIYFSDELIEKIEEINKKYDMSFNKIVLYLVKKGIKEEE